MTSIEVVVAVLGIAWLLGFWSLKDIVVGIKEIREVVKEEESKSSRKKKELSEEEIKNILSKKSNEELKSPKWTQKWREIADEILKEREAKTQEV